MEFYTVHNKKRPVRLRKKTRQFAWESLHGKYGTETMRVPDVSMDDIEGFEKMTRFQQYNLAINRIASKAPIRICEHELVSGAATLGRALSHQVPATFRGEHLFMSISHLTLGFERVLKKGINSIENEIDQGLKRNDLTEPKRILLESMKNSVSSMRIWHKRYLEALKDRKPDIYNNLLRVPFEPAQNFYQAVQSLWFTFAFTRLCGNWSGIGRIDYMLGDYLKQDLESGSLTLDEAREILASFFVKGCEWIQKDTPVGSGDAQHYQNIVLSGVDRDGNDITNYVTYLVLDIVEELGISDFPIAVRISENTPEKLLTRIAEVMGHGGGIIAVYNEPLIIDSMVRFGYSLEEARSFANDGCWEVQVPGKTYFTYYPFDSLQIFLYQTLGLKGKPAHFNDIESLYEKFKSDLKNYVEYIYNDIASRRKGLMEGNDWHWSRALPCSVVSLFTEDCIETGLSYLGGGAKYTVISPHIGGAPDVGNSLYAIQKLVFEEKKVSFDELVSILRNNWEGYETLRQYVLNKYTYYGNDHDEADQYTVRILDDFADMVAELNGRCKILFPPGVSTFGRQILWAPFRAAVPFGRKKGEILAGNASPTPGTDTTGATAVIKSYCKANLGKQTCGAALDIILHPSAVQGDNGLECLKSMLIGFVKLGGFFMQVDIMDAEVLRQAQENPENFKTLSVRVSGWNARFVTLDKEWQNMIIERTAQGF